MTPALSQVSTWLVEYNYFILFPIVVLEGPIVTVIAGWLSSLGYLNFFIAFPVVVIADLVGDSLYYSIGYWGQKRWIQKYGKYIGLSPHTVHRIAPLFLKHGGKTLIFAKLSHAVGMPFLLGAGLTKMPYGRFLWYNFISTLPKSLFFMLLGFYSGQAYVTIDRYLQYSTYIVIGLVLVVLLVTRLVGYYFDRHFFRIKNNQP